MQNWESETLYTDSGTCLAHSDAVLLTSEAAMTAPLPDDDPATPLFYRVHGRMIDRVPGPIRLIHNIGSRRRTWTGTADIAWGVSLPARLIASVLGMPAPGTGVPLSLRMERRGDGEIWTRRFGQHAMTTFLGEAPGPSIAERLRGFEVRSRLIASAAGVEQVLVSIRWLGLPLPRWLWPSIRAHEGAEGPLYTFDMSIGLPWGGLLVHYRGRLDPSGSLADPANRPSP